MSALKKQRHTPGPWVVEAIHKSCVRVRDSQGNIVSLMTCESDDGEACAAIAADAALIAAAPEMLEALRGVLRYEHHDCAHDECSTNPVPCPFGLARAIAKAQQ